MRSSATSAYAHAQSGFHQIGRPNWLTDESSWQHFVCVLTLLCRFNADDNDDENDNDDE